MKMTERLYCVRCGALVRGPVPGIGGVLIHGGHVDSTLDTTCGTWGYRVELARDREEG